VKLCWLRPSLAESWHAETTQDLVEICLGILSQTAYALFCRRRPSLEPNVLKELIGFRLTQLSKISVW
jgi:hypothetical protein